MNQPSNYNKIKRNFITGDNWLYYKIYCGLSTADEILSDVRPMSQSLIASGTISKWFFLRYTDSDPHLRIRFYINDPQKYLGNVIQSCYQIYYPLLLSNQIWNIQTDTYKREVERYGVNTMEYSESVFYFDSEMVVKAISVLDEYEEKYRWLFALGAVDSFFNTFRIPIEKKQEFCEQQQQAAVFRICRKKECAWSIPYSLQSWGNCKEALRRVSKKSLLQKRGLRSLP